MADQILRRVKSFISFANDGFKYNLETFPDTISAAAFLFTILFQSPPLGALTGSILALNVITPMLTKFLSGFIGDSAIVNNRDGSHCSGHFPGVSFERILQLSDTKMFGDLDHNGFPSYYSLFIGFITAYVGALPIIYSKEIMYSPKRKASTTLGLVVLAIIITICTIYRIFSTCETPLSMIVGLVGGALFGLLCVGFLSYISDRRLTNILSFPLIRNRAADGKPIYVCEKMIKKPPPACVKPLTPTQAGQARELRQVYEKGSKITGIPLNPQKLDDFIIFVEKNKGPNGQLDGAAMNQSLTILGVTMEQAQQIVKAGSGSAINPATPANTKKSKKRKNRK
jgi:hypothetical protein